MENNQPTPEFLTWLIGFAEGDGSFSRLPEVILYFVILKTLGIHKY